MEMKNISPEQSFSILEDGECLRASRHCDHQLIPYLPSSTSIQPYSQLFSSLGAVCRMRVQPNEGSPPRARLDQVPVSRPLLSSPSLFVHYPRHKHNQFSKLYIPFTLLHSFIVLIHIFNCIFTWSPNPTLICIITNILCIRSRRTGTIIWSFPA